MKILLIGIDGLCWDKVAESTTPHLDDLYQRGSWHRMTMEVPTISGPGWASILTGNPHSVHGISDNSFTGHRLYNCPDVLSKAFYQDQTTRTYAAAGWPPIVDPAGPGPIIHQRKEQQLAGIHRVIVRDGETYGYAQADAEICDFSLLALRGDETFDMGFVYFCTVDDAGHIYGTEGPEYPAAISSVDALVGKLVAQVEQRSRDGEEWLVVVVTDHGHRSEGGHGGGSEREYSSFVMATGFNSAGVDWPEEIAPHSLCERLLALR